MTRFESRATNAFVLSLALAAAVAAAPGASQAKPKRPTKAPARATEKAAAAQATPVPGTPTTSSAAVPEGLPFTVESSTQGWGTLQYNKSVGGAPFTIAGKTYSSGLGTHAYSRIVISFPDKHKKFSGRCGINDVPGQPGSAVFKVMDQDKVLFESKKITAGSAAVDFSVKVAGLSRLTLVVEEAGDGFNSDHANWVDLKFE